jgi:hypothetical protein
MGVFPIFGGSACRPTAEHGGFFENARDHGGVLR